MCFVEGQEDGDFGFHGACSDHRVIDASANDAFMWSTTQ